MASTEQRELDLIDKVNLRILNVANDGPKLTALLKVYLPPLLLKAGSEHAAVRNKVVLVAGRLKTFIASPDVILPVASLLDQYIKNPDAPVIRQLDIGFIKHSFERISPTERRELVPVLVKGIGTDKGVMGPMGPTVAARFNLFLHTLKDIELPPRGSKEDEAFRATLNFDDPVDANFTAKWLGKLLLLTLPAPGRVGSIAPGLNDSDTGFLFCWNLDETWVNPGSLDLATTRIHAVKFLESGAFTDDERFLPSIYAASHTDYRINRVGEAMLKRNKASLEDEDRVQHLFAAHAALPAPYRIRILGLLCKSNKATSPQFTEQMRALVERDIGTGQGAAAGTDAPANGLELTKLHRALFEFVNWVARMGPSHGAFPIGPTLIRMLMEFITVEQGWPKPKVEKRSTNPRDDQNLRARAYETIGVLAKGSSAEPQLLPKELMDIVIFLFESLSHDPTPDVVVSIEGALSSMSTVYKSDGGDRDESLRSLILGHMTLSQNDTDVFRTARHTATKWANLCLPFSDTIARWVDVLAIAGRKDERTEVVEEGQKGLDPWTYRVNEEHITTNLPDWRQLVRTFFKSLISSGYGTTLNAPEALRNFTGLAPAAFPTAIAYCKRMLFLTALKDEFKVEPGWERQLETLVAGDKETRETIRRYLAGLDGTDLTDLLGAAFEGIQEDKSTTEECTRSFVEIASLCPRDVLAPLAVNGLGSLLDVLKSNKKEVRQLAARALGILGAHPAVPVEMFNAANYVLLQRCLTWKTAVGAEMNATEGAFLALGYLWSRATYYPHAVVAGTQTVGSGPPPLKRRKTDAVQKLDDKTALKLRELLEAAGAKDAPDTTKIQPREWLPPVEELGATGAQGTFQNTIFDTLAQLWTASILPEEASITSYVDVLVPQAKKGNERAITALGRLAIGLKDDDAVLDLILTKLYELHELKQAEVHFSIGEAITAAVARWDSDIVQLSVDVATSTQTYRVGGRCEKIQEVLNKILTDCKGTKPSLLKASGIWLFCIIQHCSHLPHIQARLRECQVAFMRLLSARDELVQETASRGLSLVYEKGDPELKDALVKDLVGAFTGASATQLKVEEETELFEAGALPTGEGKSVTSYKDIVNLANEVGDQTLVYKFMSLASNAATWSTRSAFGRFGLSNILSESEVDPKLYPKLFRYRFDPNPNVQRSMNDIWKALVKDSNADLETHFDAIMEDLLKSIHGKEWRVRQASCTAISDLIGGRPFQQYEKYYAEIWTKALKVLDDVKATVREQAMKLCMGMANTLTRQLEEGGVSASAKDMMSSTLPFLLSDNGIESSVEEVKGFAISTVITITKTGGKALAPYIATIITHMLGLLSTIEPEAVNYYYQRFKEDDRGKIDKIRSQMVNQSPIFQAIENCLRNVDSSVMPALATGLEDTIKSAIGMPTKVGCGRVLGTLATRHTTDFQPYASRFLQLMEKHALDKNDEVSTGYARAAAYIMRHAPAPAREHFVGRFTTLYFTAEDEARREKVAAVVAALSKISPDHFTALEASLLPLSYLGMHDTDTFVAKAFREVWETHAGSSRTVTRFVPEVVALVERALEAPMWSLKHAGALTAGSAVGAVAAQGGLTGGSVNVKQMGELWGVFEKSLALKTFEGKEKLLDALVDVHTHAKPFWSADEKIAAGLRKIVLREAKRNNEEYRVHAFACLWKCAAARDDLQGVGLWEDVVAIVKPTLEEYGDEDRMDVDGEGNKGEDGGKKRRERELLVYKTVLNAVEAVGRGYNRAQLRREPVAVLRAVLDVLDGCGLRSRRFDGVRREVWYGCVEDVMLEAAKTTTTQVKEDNESKDGAEEVSRSYFATLDVDKPDEGVETQRLGRAKACLALVKAVNGGVFGGKIEDVKGEMKRVVEVAKEGERSADVRKVMEEVLGEL
ncbi:proteasome component M29 [Gnomoniopsis sp. IMI 355080]|nr:proteasome component M29 [Gnomoniopsis sp. IMI 355080]